MSERDEGQQPEELPDDDETTDGDDPLAGDDATADEGASSTDGSPDEGAEDDPDDDADEEPDDDDAADGASDDVTNEDPRTSESEEETRRRQEEFAAEHDPADHDVAAGEEFRQPGDWVADEDGEPQHLETDHSMPAATGAEEGGGTGEGASDADEVRDGGHGWGSAAPLADGGTPEGHPVKAWHDTMTYVLPDEEGYDADPHECFVDAETAEQAGFRHAHD
ncbi:sunset domain-containing protein [Serinicoccus kebangsaanensis]|uniref:sunset domain-containing protein n=1 Tax=Serinicoccus kebangsaanensis TaxID=2602069 RepID=UPI00124F6E12|nr:hypothetical protein [Serinicoccus kebangsaanensis]